MQCKDININVSFQIKIVIDFKINFDNNCVSKIRNTE